MKSGFKNWVKQFVYWLPWAIYFLIFLKNVYTYPEYVQDKLFGLPVWGLGLLVLVATWIWKFWQKIKFSWQEIIPPAILAGLSFICCAYLFQYEAAREINAVLLDFKLHLPILIQMSLAAFGLTFWQILWLDKEFAQWRSILLPWLFLPILFLIKWLNLPFFIIMGKENNLIEIISVIIVFCACGLAVFKLVKIWPHRHQFRPLVLALAIWVMGMFVIAGEEISWSQSFLGFESPTVMLEINQQQETNLHNIAGVHELMAVGYVIVGLWGGFSWLLRNPAVMKFLSKWPRFKEFFYDFVPHFSNSFWFYGLLIYGLAKLIVGPLTYKTWEETAEMVGWVGFLMTIQQISLPTLSKKA